MNMFQQYTFTVADRFMRYVQIDTQSDPLSNTHPSTDKQKDLSRLLVQELHQIGITDAELDEQGYVYATIPSNTSKNVPVLCFCSHVDTAPDASGAGVKPLIHYRYDGNDIVLPDDHAQVIRIKDHPYLQQKIGEDIITASGKTLLGADDKAGIAIIMDLANYLVKHPEIKHGKIRILFTPDEEIGHGVDRVNMEKLGADFGYTLDGGERGSFTDENFSADGVELTINGVITHPGYAKDKMINAMKIAGDVLASLPRSEMSPETTSDRQGFIHPVRVNGLAEKCTIDFIIRDFAAEGLKKKEEFLLSLVEMVMDNYPGASFDFKVLEQYRNMKEVMDKHPHVTEYAKMAMERAGVTFERKSARGGTDGARLSFMGLPCPDIFTGEMAFHSKHEYVSIQDMQKAVETLVNLVTIWEEKGGN